MYKQIYETKAKSLPMILMTVVIGLILLCIPTIFKITAFLWVYELAVVIFTSFAVYTILKRSSYVYSYMIIDDEVSVKLTIGKREIILCSFEIRDIISVDKGNISEIKKRNNCALVYKCFGGGDVLKTTQIVFSEEEDKNKISMLVFMPDTEFLNILNKKRLDIQAKV